MSDDETRRTIEAIWRMHSAKVVARLARLVGDVATAEDLAQDTFVAAMQRWPRSGVPDNPGGWLMATARYLAIDHLRRKDLGAEKQQLAARLERSDAPDPAALAVASGDDTGDELLGLIFMACHPVLAPEARAALVLRLLGGLRTDEIARAYLVQESTVAQRIVRAKRTLAAANVRFEVPDAEERRERMASVLDAIYLMFNEGYSATSGDDWMRVELCHEAMRLGRVLATITPEQPEVHGLVALMELQASRTRARTARDGTPVLLLDQNRGLWDQVLIRRGLAALDTAERLGGTLGPYALQAAVAACHARARAADQTDWGRIAAVYDALSQVAPSPVVEVNRAMALAMAFGPEAGLALADELVAVPELAGYHPLPSVRGDLLARLGRHAEAREEFVRAASLTRNTREQAVLLARAAECAAEDGSA